jgi:Ca2+/Na+ antiporter
MAVLVLIVTCTLTLKAMKKCSLILIFSLCLVFLSATSQAQCSVCTRTAEQLGEKPARGLNAGILYLAFTPLAMLGIMGYRWWKKNEKEA